MSRSAERGAERPLAAYQLLVQAYQKLPTPDLDHALEASRRIIDLTDDRIPDVLAQARLSHAELLLRKDLHGEAIRELERIGTKPSASLRSKGKLLLAQCCEQEGMWSTAAAAWRDLLADASLVPGGKARVLYSLGCAAVQLETPDEKSAIQAWEEAAKLGGPEAQAAGLRLGALRLFGSSPEPARALDDWQHALAAIQTPADYHNPFLPVSDLRAFFDQALGLFSDRQEFDRMQTVAALDRKLASDGQADEKVAQAVEAYAKKLHADKAKEEVVRTHYRQAAEHYEQAALSWSDKQRLNALWQSARCFLEARDTDRADRILKQMHHLDKDDARLAEGWFLLGETYRELGQKDLATQAYLLSMSYAVTPFAARARYQLAMNHVEKRNWKEAADILQPNLFNSEVDREAHESSLYLLAWLHLQQADEQSVGLAHEYLAQATRRYPNNPKALVARSQLGDICRRLADKAYEREQGQYREFGPAGAEAARQYRETRHKWLREAVSVYQALAEELDERQRQRPLTDLEAALGRRALLGAAECHQEQGHFVDALNVYMGLVQRFRARLETLIACERIVQLQKLDLKLDLLSPDGKRELAKTARAALAQAQADLGSMKADSEDFRGERVWTWQDWQTWIAAEQKRLNIPPIQ
jgi:tetratricopeptide (TPR) repeat protein